MHPTSHRFRREYANWGHKRRFKRTTYRRTSWLSGFNKRVEQSIGCLTKNIISHQCEQTLIGHRVAHICFLISLRCRDGPNSCPKPCGERVADEFLNCARNFCMSLLIYNSSRKEGYPNRLLCSSHTSIEPGLTAHLEPGKVRAILVGVIVYGHHLFVSLWLGTRATCSGIFRSALLTCSQRNSQIDFRHSEQLRVLSRK